MAWEKSTSEDRVEDTEKDNVTRINKGDTANRTNSREGKYN